MKRGAMKKRCLIVALLALTAILLFYSHFNYSRRAAAARVLPEGCAAIPGRVYFVSLPENCLAVSAGRSAATDAVTSRNRRLTRRVAKGITSTCCGAAFPARMRPASEPKNCLA